MRVVFILASRRKNTIETAHDLQRESDCRHTSGGPLIGWSRGLGLKGQHLLGRGYLCESAAAARAVEVNISA